ncbi:MAG: phosphate ABC transporter permease PstA [Planctomycetota bacterium]
MRVWQRQSLNRSFTVLSAAAVALMAAALIVLLLPILLRGSRAVVFRGTVEFREMVYMELQRGDPEALPEALEKELAEAEEARRPMYELIDQFGMVLQPYELSGDARAIYRDCRDELRRAATAGEMDRDRAVGLIDAAKDIRNRLSDAFESTDRVEALTRLEGVLNDDHRPALEETAAAELFTMAETYAKAVRETDLSRRQDYGAAYAEVVEVVRELFGPRPGDEAELLGQLRYGATRLDRTQVLMDRLLYAETWVEVEPGEPLQKKRVPRTEQFAGTVLADLFPMVENNLDAMLRPEPTFYWRYFFDKSISGKLFGGVGKEIWGTLLLAGTAMAFAFPLGVISAAYLVEGTSEGRVVSVIRTCINTLAGVPSIVFGLFGLAFFVLFLIPLFGGPSTPSILAGGLTLGVLVLPIIIRASEEAIKSVPPSYKEASLALGAGTARTFLTVTFPAALPGILTGVILALSRAAGETAPILFTAAVWSGHTGGSLLEPTEALPYSAYKFATGDKLAAQAPHNQYGMIMTLILLVLIMNVGAIALRGRISRKLRG